MRGGAAPPAAPGAGAGAPALPRLLLLCACLLPVGAQSDIIFRVPEVLVRHAAGARPVGTGTPLAATRSNFTASGVGGGGGGSGGGGGAAERDGLLDLRYEEYFVEHEVSTVDARKAAQALNLDDTLPPEGCGSCSRREMEYCRSRALADHCCCERRHVPEPLGWLPHTCYAGPARCRPRARDCARYARLRDCCCRHQLAVEWKGILAGSAPAPRPPGLQLAAPLLLAAALLL